MREQDLEEEVLEALHAGPEGYRALLRNIARAYPEYPAQQLVAALIRVAEHMDALIHHAGHSTDEARRARSLARSLSDYIAQIPDGRTTVTVSELASQ